MISTGALWIWPILGIPLLLAAFVVAPAVGKRSLALLPLAPLPALIASLFAPAGTADVASGVLLGAHFAVEGYGRLFLGFTALLWITAGFFAHNTMAGNKHIRLFVVCWCLTLAGNLGVFIAQDVASFYTAFACLSLAAYALVIHARDAEARRAGLVYLVLALIGETCLLLGFLLAAAGADSLVLADVRAAIVESPHVHVIVLLLVIGFGIKAGLVPLHVWLPLAHPAAPTPASAVLSGAIVKAGIFGLMQFLPLGADVNLPHGAGINNWHNALLWAGLFTAYYAVVVGIAQKNPKTVLAYSTVSQMGLVIALLATGLAQNAGHDVLGSVSFYALHHGLAKGALFLGVSVVAATGVNRVRPMLILLALPALSLAGFPLFSGALAKLQAKPLMDTDLAAFLFSAAAFGTALLMARFILVVSQQCATSVTARAGRGLTAPWMLTTLASLVAPWAVYVSAFGSSFWYALTAANVWSGFWPVALAVVIALFARHARVRAPAIPAGDLLAPIERAIDSVANIRWPVLKAFNFSLARRLGSEVKKALSQAGPKAEQALSRWAVAGTLLVVVAMVAARSI